MQELFVEVRRLEKELKESQTTTKLLLKLREDREEELKDPKNIFLLFEAIDVDLSHRRIACGWCDPARNYEPCATPATDVLPRPAIFVCVAHREEWSQRVAEAEAEGGEARAKRAKKINEPPS